MRTTVDVRVSAARALFVAWVCGLVGCGDGGAETVPDTIDTIDTIDASDTIDTIDTSDDVDAIDSGEPLETAEDVSDVPDDGDATTEPVTFRIGYRQDSVTYEPADGSGPRTLRVVYWYPTDASEGEAVSYLQGFLPADGVLGDAPPRTAGGPLPVVVFSHGNSGFAEQSIFFTEFLAAHGYLVVSLDHTGNTFIETPEVAIFYWRPMDISAVIDHVLALPAAHPLAGVVGDTLAVTGHSFGGYTTLAVGGAEWDLDSLLAYCEVDEIPLDGCSSLVAHGDIYRAGFLDARVDALVPMAPGATVVFGAGGIAAIEVPTLLVTGARDGTTTNEDDGDPTWAQLASSPDNLRIDFANGGHFTFSDACALPIPIGEDDGCGETFIAPATAHAAVNAYALAFLDLHLRHDDGGLALLSGAIAIEPDVTLSRGGGDGGGGAR